MVYFRPAAGTDAWCLHFIGAVPRVAPTQARIAPTEVWPIEKKEPNRRWAGFSGSLRHRDIGLVGVNGVS